MEILIFVEDDLAKPEVLTAMRADIQERYPLFEIKIMPKSQDPESYVKDYERDCEGPPPPFMIYVSHPDGARDSHMRIIESVEFALLSVALTHGNPWRA